MYFGIVGKYFSERDPIPVMQEDLEQFPALKLAVGITAIVVTIWLFKEDHKTEIAQDLKKWIFKTLD